MEYKFSGKNKNVAMFDLDGTIITTKSGKKFPIDKNDFKFLYPSVPEKIKELRENGYKIVVFSNQKGISTGKTDLSDITSKIEKTLGKDTDYFISIENDRYRKPYPTMFMEFLKLNGPVEKVFYVGDAAGRKKDFSDSDINFAHNASLESGYDVAFYTPEEFFKGEVETIKPTCPIFPESCNVPKPSSFGKNVVVMLMGYPGSGKSTFAKMVKSKSEQDVHIISNDELTPKKAEALYKKLLKERNNVIFIDNLNTTRKNREFYIKNGRENGYKIIGINIVTSMELSMFMNKYRFYKEDRELVPDVVYYTYRKRFEKPELEEGFDLVFEMIPEFTKVKYCF